MFCHLCGAVLPDEAVFCMKCGAKLPTLGADARSAAPPGPGAAPAGHAPPLASPPAAPLSPEAHTAARAGAAAVDPRTEREVWTGRYSARALGAHAMALGAFTALVLALAISVGGPYWLWAALILIPGLVLLGRLAYCKWTIRYRLTTQRFFHTYGFLVQRTDELELVRIDDVTLEQNIIERMFDVGTLAIDSTDKSEPRKLVKGIAHPQKLKELIRSYTVQLRQNVLRVHNL
jgi:uncharacterized membrane protein YdbT with pleckstrin-like domain/ribosomal protein L40E